MVTDIFGMLLRQEKYLLFFLDFLLKCDSPDLHFVNRCRRSIDCMSRIKNVMSVDYILPFILRHHIDAFDIFKMYVIKVVHLIVFSSSL